ncbi:MAG: DUF2203 family protein [Methanobacteriota archaeon]|nr:MAG: DUF2203 family protein [Euryarchaeota archaeon]
MNEDLFSRQEIPVRALHLVEAQEKIHFLEPMLREAVDLFHRYKELREELLRMKGENADQIAFKRFQLDQICEHLHELKLRFLQNDVIVHDWERGIINFITLREFEPVFLCYKMGDMTITHFYKFSEDYSKRKRIDFS